MWWFLLACHSVSTVPRSGPDLDDVATDTDPPGPTTSSAGPPSLAAVDPALGDVLGGVTLTLTGSALDGIGEVLVGGAPCADLLVLPDGSLSCTAPALDPGLHDVVATAPGGASTLTAAWEAWSPTLIPGAHVYTTSQGVLSEPLAESWVFTEEAATSPWHPRDGAGLVWFGNELWLLGGWYPPFVPEWDGQITTNEVWSSSDLGKTWVLRLPHDSDPPTSGPGARWGRRHTAGWLAHTHDGVEYLYVVGGDIYQVTGDVWRSADGVTWEQVEDAAPWGGRVLQMVGSYDGSLYVMGGQMALYDPGTALADVWRSDDGGATWLRLPDAPWAPRGMVYNPFEHDGRLWLVGGGTYDDAPRTFYDDVWSFDGATWTEVSPDGAAPWTGREYHNTFSAFGELWVSSGYDEDGLNRNDVWHSLDGVTWTEVAAVPFAPGHADGVAVTPSSVVHASGNALDTAVYSMAKGATAPVLGWEDQAGDADLASPEPPLLVAGAFGGEDGVRQTAGSYLQLDAWEHQPDGRTVFWIGRTDQETVWTDFVNPAMTVVGDSNGACRAQAGYSADQAHLVVTDALGAWSAGHVLAGSGLNDDEPHLVGFTHAPDGTVEAWVDGARAGGPAATSYDAPYMGWDLIGAGYAFGSRADLTLGLVVVVPGVVADQDLEKLATFARKWGVSP